MPRTTTGSIYAVKGGFRIRWVEGDKRPTSGQTFRTRRDARVWWDEKVGPQLRRGGPSPEITLAAFTEMFLERWGPDKALRTRTTLREWLKPALATFGDFTLAELEGALDDIARWRATLPSEDRRHKATRALRQVLAAAVRWGYIVRNPALDAGQNPTPRSDEIRPLRPDEIDRIVAELGPQDVAIVIFAVETGLRTNEWLATERRDLDRQNPAVAVQRRYTDGSLIPYPKTYRRRVPLTPEAAEALEQLPARIDTPILFPGEHGGHLNLNNWRNRVWYPALDAAGVPKCGPYVLRHSFATNALRKGLPIYQLARLMGTSVKIIDKHYGHLAHDSEDHLRSLLSARSGSDQASEEQR